MPFEAGKIEHVYGPGSYTDNEFIPVPQDAERLLKYFASKTPGFTRDLSQLEKVKFGGSDMSIIPGPLKPQVLTAVLHGMIGIVASEISTIKGIDTGSININTDHAGLYPATPGLVTIGKRPFKELGSVSRGVGADVDGGSIMGRPMRVRMYSIYPTKDAGAWFQFHGSLNPAYVMEKFGLNEDGVSSLEEGYERIRAMTLQKSARDLEQICMENGLCGSSCFTPAGWRQTRMGIDVARHPLIDYKRVTTTPHLAPVPFPKLQDQRPLAGIKVLDLTRVIAGPTVSSLLASLGAEVVRVQPPHLHDLQILNLTLTAGKRTAGLNVNEAKAHKHLEKLMAEADVVVQAFRLRSLERRGFGLEHALDIANKRGKGIVYLDENCYGPDGYYAERPGFQQIADAASGAEYVCGQAYGPGGNAPVLPSLPISDMLTGAVGVIDVLLALRDRAIHGGSYHAHATLVAANTAQLEREVGLYPPDTVAKIQETHKFAPIRPEDNAVPDLMNVVIDAWRETTDLLGRDEFFQKFVTPFGKDHRILAPVVKFENQAVSPVWRTGPVPLCWEEYPLFETWNDA